MTRRSALLVSVVAVAALTACRSSGVDAAGDAACNTFRELAANAFSESLTESEVVTGLQNVGELAEASTTRDIRDKGVKVGNEANASAMISGEPDAAQDAFADACNLAFGFPPTPV